MARAIKKRKNTYFVCCGLSQGEVVMRSIQASNFSEARRNFESETKISPEVISGPFFKKRGCDQECYEEMKFSGVSKKAIFDGWEVNAQILTEPENMAFLFYKKRVDGQNLPQPNGDVVHLQNLRFI